MFEERVTKDTLKVTDLEILSKLPDILTFDDGSPVVTKEDFEKRRGELFKTAVEMQYGTLPPAPEFVKVDVLFPGNYGKAWVYRITTGTKEHPVSFRMKLMLPPKDKIRNEKIPVVVDGDLCFNYAMNRAYLDPVLEAGFAWALFDRTELVPDYKFAQRSDGPLYNTYPDKTFGALAAWAWGYGRVVDALEIIGITDMNAIAFTGHSRGGKTALLAGVMDQRAMVVNANESGAGGSGCYRVHTKARYMGGEEKRSEELCDLVKNFPHWFGPEMNDYTTREGELPFDEHFLKALVAPRVFFTSEASGDIWANAPGTYMTTMAAKPVYELLGAPENLLWYWRHGPHFHEVIDVKMLVNVMNHKLYGTPLDERMLDVPFDVDEL